jgi:CheY-like chemotaxis protein
VVLMDLQMPVLDGIETIRLLCAAESGKQPASSAVHSPHQLVITLSANSDDETRLAALEAGAAPFMVKPFTYENF